MRVKIYKITIYSDINKKRLEVSINIVNHKLNNRYAFIVTVHFNTNIIEK
jgi:hypothetical protein